MKSEKFKIAVAKANKARAKYPVWKCLECGKEFRRYRPYIYSKFCCLSCSGKYNGKTDNPKMTYENIHCWVSRRLTKPELCENCHKSKAYDMANISGKYLKELSDWRYLCRKCHMESDGRMHNLKVGLWNVYNIKYKPRYNCIPRTTDATPGGALK